MIGLYLRPAYRSRRKGLVGLRLPACRPGISAGRHRSLSARHKSPDLKRDSLMMAARVYVAPPD